MSSSRAWLVHHRFSVSVATLLLAAHAFHHRGLSDDAFISLRYARNLLDGNGLVFNAGERVEGFTSLTWTLAAAAAGMVGLDMLTAIRALCLLSSVLLLWLCVPLTRAVTGSGAARPTGWVLALPALLTAFSAPVAVWSLAGLETTGFALAVAASVWTSLQASRSWRRGLLAGAVLALTALTRPEGALVALVLCAIALIAARLRGGLPGVLIMSGSFIATKSAHLLWRYSYFQDWLPNTYYVKVGHNLASLERGVEYLFQYTRDSGGLFLWLLPLVASLWRRDQAWWSVAAVWATLVASVAWVGGDGLFMYRFMVPSVALWAILLASLAADARALWSRLQLPVGFVPMAGAAALVALVAFGLARPDQKSRQFQLFLYQREVEIPDWTAVGEYFRDHARPGDSIACTAIGAIAYYSGLTLYDMLGLTDAHIARLDIEVGRGWAGHEKHDGPYILSRKPTYLLLGNVRVRDEPLPLDAEIFVRVNHKYIGQREGDMFTPELDRDYERAVARLSNGRYLHYLRRRAEVSP